MLISMAGRLPGAGHDDRRQSIRTAAVFVGLCLSGPVCAYDGFTSEISHVAGGALMAGTSTYLADRFNWNRDHRALFGFGAGAALGVLGELASSGPSAIDIVSNVLGAAVGAYSTDRWLLRPVIRQDAARGMYWGMEMQFAAY